VSSTPILVPPAVKMFRCDCHERTCSPGTNQTTQIGAEEPETLPIHFPFENTYPPLKL
ncbi:hypothetical protein KUCAC02_011769, partial [Chaenocephalus aceratus]